MKNTIIIFLALFLTAAFVVAQDALYKQNSKVLVKKILNTSDSSSLKNAFPKEGFVSDNDGNLCQYKTIGTQVWMTENLRTTRYRNGDTIPNVTSNSVWSTINTGACCDYNNNPANTSKYGKLYNFFAVFDSRNIAPPGWHVATDADWTKLINFLGGESVAGGKMKEKAAENLLESPRKAKEKSKEYTTNWCTPNVGATNESGFNGLPGGYRYGYGTFYTTGFYGFWWSSTESHGVSAWSRNLYYGSSEVIRYDGVKSFGFSVRCVKDDNK